MPFINSKITTKVSEEKKEAVKAALGQAVSVLDKTEDWVMVNIEDQQDIWFGGKKKETAAYVGLELVGNPSGEASLDFTKKVCDIYEKELGIPKDSVYLTLKPVEGVHWGWNDQTF